MAAAKPPTWRRVVDAVDARVAPPVEDAVQADLFMDVLALLLRGRRFVLGEIERSSRRMLHLVNLPAASDVKRLSEQLAALQRQTRALEHELERQGRERRD
jgi:hypothetical protein